MKPRPYLTIKLATFFLSCLLAVGMFPQKTQAQTAEEFGVVINLAGKQRMLTQKMSKEVMLIALDVNKEENLKNLEATSKLFDKTLQGLKVGDSDLGLPAISSTRTLRQLDKIENLWKEFYPHIQSIISQKSVNNEALAAIATQNLPLLKEMNKAVGAYEKEAAKSGIAAAEGFAATINLSGKQRMLTQKMSKEFLMIAHGYEEQTNRLNLLETYTLFERTLIGLEKGDDTLGLPGTTDDSINAQLQVVRDLWKKAKPVFENASKEGAKPTSSDVQLVATLNLPLLKEMNKAVGMYERLAK